MPIPDLITAAEFSAGTGGKISVGDPRLPSLIAGASAAIRRYCGWHITPVIDETVTLDGPGGSLLSLKTLHMTALTSVTASGIAVDLASGVEWSELGNLRRMDGGWWTDRYRSIEVTFTHGFENAADVKQIVQQVIANAISSPLGATREQAGQVSISWSMTAPNVSGGITLMERDLAVLDAYKLSKVT